MSTITLPNIRVSSDLEIRLKLKDGGVAIDWSTLTNIKASIYSDRQRSLAGRCDIEIDEDDNTILVCRYSANKPQYPGVNRVIVCCTYDGETKTYDKPAFTFVRWTDDQAGQSITIDDPDIDVEISVEDVSSSILQEAVEAAFSAAERADEAAAAAEHMVDIHTGPAGKSPYIGENGHWYEWDEETSQYVDTEENAQGDPGVTPDITIGTVTTVEPGTPAAATMTGTPEAPVLNLTIPKGVAGDTPAFTVGEVTTGQPGTPVVVTITGTAAAPVLNITIPQGMQGNTGSSVDYPYELVNNLTTNDATKGLTAAQGKVLKDEISQLEAEVNGYTETTETTTPQTITQNRYYNTNSNPIPSSPNASSTGTACSKVEVTPGEVYRITGLGGATSTKLWAICDSNRERLSRADDDVNARTTPVELTMPSGAAYLFVNLKTYDSDTDKVEKVETETVHHDGMTDEITDLDTRVTALENSALPSAVDSLDSTSTTAPLAANQGRVINEMINGTVSESEVLQEIRLGKTWNSNNNIVPARANLVDNVDNAVSYIYCQPGDKFRIYGADGGTSATRLYAIADEDREVLVKADYPTNARVTPVEVTIPANGVILLVVYRSYASATDKTYKVETVQTDCIDKRLDTLEDKIDKPLPLTGKKVMFFGDSVTEFTYNGKGLVDYFAEASQATCYKAAIGGSRLSQRTTPVDTPTTENEARAALDICNMVKAWTEASYTKQEAAATYLSDYSAQIQAMKDCPVANADIVFFASGGNDLSAGVSFGNDDDTSLTTINGAINEIVTMLLTANPALKIYVYSPLVGYRSNTRDDEHWSDNWIYTTYNKTKPELIELLEKRVRAWHIPYINLYWNLGWNQLNFSNYYVSTDGTHPYKGFDVLGRRIYQQVVSLIQ